MCGLTYSAHPIGCAAGCATLEVYEDERLIENSKRMGVVLGNELERLKAKHPAVGDVRYIGLFSAIELIKNTKTREALVPYDRGSGADYAEHNRHASGEGFFNLLA